MPIKICETCKKEFTVKEYRFKIARFCSTKCRSKILMGCYRYWLGKKRNKNTIRKISDSQKLNWEGHERIDWEGYVFVRDDNHPYKNNRGYVRKHRKITEDYMGCLLNKKWEVHHIDKNKKNNNISNLIVFATKSAHRRFELGKSKVYKQEIILDGRKLCQK